MPRDVQGGLRQERAVGHDRAAVGAESPEPLQELGVTGLARPEDLDAGLLGELGDGTRLDLAAPPDWASGRVTTATTSWRGESIRARNEGRPVRGTGEDQAQGLQSLPVGRVRENLNVGGRRQAAPLGLADLLHRELALLAVQPVDEQHAVQVVGLVLEAAGQQVGALEGDRLAVHVEARRHAAPPGGVG